MSDEASSGSRRSNNNVDYYAILGCSPRSSDADIRKAHRNLALVLHPDRLIAQQQKQGAIPPEVQDLIKARFLLINEAFETLSDPNKRAAYDAAGPKGVKNLALIVPEGEHSRYDPATLRRLLKLADEEASLLKTAVRVGATSNIELTLNGHIIGRTVMAATQHLAQTMTTWLEDDPDTEWSIPGGERRVKKTKMEKAVADSNKKEGGESHAVAVSSEKKDDEPAPTPPPLPTAPAKPEFTIKEPIVLVVEVNGQKKLALIPSDADQPAVKAGHEAAAKETEKYQKQLEQYALDHPEEAKRLALEEQKKQQDEQLKQQHQQPEKQQDGDDGEAQQQQQQQPQENIIYGRPPLPVLIGYWGYSWAPTLQKNFRTALTPATVSGRYAWQMPLGSSTVSLFSVHGSKNAKASEFRCEIDAETRSSSDARLTWLWSLGLGTSGTKLQLGFKKVLSKLWSIRAKLPCWREQGDGWLPHLYVAAERKLSPLWKLSAGWRIPGPWEEEKVGNMSVSAESKDSGFGLRLGVGSIVATYVKMSPFVFFPMVAASSSSSAVTAAAAASSEGEGNEEQNQQQQQQQQQSSALKSLRRVETSREKTLELHLNLREPILRHEDTFFFTQSFDSDSWEEDRRRRAEKAARQRQQQTKKKQEGEHADDDDDDKKQQQKKVEEEIFDSDSEFDFDGEEDHDAADDASTTAENNNSSSSNEFKDHFEHKYSEQKEKDQARSLASALLRHCIGVSVSCAVPIVPLLTGNWPQNRGVNTTVSLVYKRGEHKINLPIRLSFSHSIWTGMLVSAAPYLLNMFAAPAVSQIVAGREKKRIVDRRTRDDAKVRAARARAALEQEGMMSSIVRNKIAVENSKPDGGGLIIVQAQYGVLHPRLQWAADVDLTMDATIPIQNLVQGSEVHIAAGSPKSILVGLCDVLPFTGGVEKKLLKVVYRFQGRLHEVAVGDREALHLPMVEHIVKA